jgi:hypothetical protein
MAFSMLHTLFRLTSAVGVVCVLLVTGTAKAQQEFPQIRVSNTQLEGVWRASPIVAVGEVDNITSYGKQSVDRIPALTSPKVHYLYWCQGDFKVTAVVKGELPGPPSEKYLWASTFPGCKLLPDNPRSFDRRSKTRAWFLREDRGFLRPTFDYGTHRFYGFLTKWEDGPPLPGPQRVGALLLKPAANSDRLEDYAYLLVDMGDIACELLGKGECIRRIKDLARLGSPMLREYACGFLKGQLREDCDSR